MRTLTVFVLASLLAGVALAESTKLGQPVGDGPMTPIAELMAKPEAFAGKIVKVRGEVHGVCEMMGCWMELKDHGSEVRIKVEDGVLVFPKEAKGRWAVATGTVAIKEMTREEYVAWAKHLADEMGEEFDESSIKPPYRLVEIEGSGAEIEGK
jgi:Domain of unknown function (DUF4920)